MLFKITSVDSEKNTVIQYYDNITQHVYDSEKNRITFDDPKFSQMKDFNAPVKNRELFGIETSVKHLKIQFGLKCNFHCKYCNQRHDRALDKDAKLGNYREVVDNLMQRLIDKNVTTDSITLWGGEPLVYFKVLKILVPRLREHFGKKIRINTISNGSLLTDKIVDFFIENRMSLTISHDGPSFNVYRDDKNPLDNPRVVKALQRFYDFVESDENKQARQLSGYKEIGLSINVVVTPENCDITELQHYFESKVGRPIKFHFEGIVKCDRSSDKIITRFDQHTHAILMNSVFVAGTSDPTGPYWALRSRVSDFMASVINQCDMSEYSFGCDANSGKSFSVDLQGNILACHGSSAETSKIGVLEDLPGLKNFLIIPYQDRPNCTTCPTLALCKGGCPLAEEEDHAIACRNLKMWYSAMFAAAWYNMFQLTLKRIEPCPSL